jgi:hypothetical protein
MPDIVISVYKDTVYTQTLTNTTVVMFPVSGVTFAFKASLCVDTCLRAHWFARCGCVAFVHINTSSSISISCVPNRTSTCIWAWCITAPKFAWWGSWSITLVDIYALTFTSSSIYLITRVAQASVWTKCVDTSAILTGTRHQATFIQVYINEIPSLVPHTAFQQTWWVQLEKPNCISKSARKFRYPWFSLCMAINQKA